MEDGFTVDLTIEKLVAEFYVKNLKDGKITPEYCLELISRAPTAEAQLEIAEQAIAELEETVESLTKQTTLQSETIGRLFDELSQFKLSKAI